jgi:hypothetical protein
LLSFDRAPHLSQYGFLVLTMRFNKAERDGETFR